MRLYTCLAACKQGYKPAVGVDANASLYPIAYIVVETENQSAWYWFLSLLDTDLEIESNHNITFIPDKQKMILEARDKPILTLMELVRTKIMQKISMKKEEADKYTGILYPKIQAKVELTTQQSTSYRTQTQRPPGRLKKKRVKEVYEPSNSTSRFTKRGATMYYSKCRKASHNQRTCKGEVDGNILVNALKGTTNQRVGAPVSRPTTSSAQTNPFFFIPTLGLQSHPTQQPPSGMTFRWMPTSQENYNVSQSQSITLTQNVQEDTNYEDVRK
ncbi:hypothetical protein V6N13_080321 [Hibiscus sabdariffa]